MASSRPNGKLHALAERVKRELLDAPRPNIGRSTLTIGFILGLVWIGLLYVQPELPSVNRRFLVGAICFLGWGMADMLPYRFRWIAVILRAAVLVFMIILGAWILLDLIASF